MILYFHCDLLKIYYIFNYLLHFYSFYHYQYLSFKSTFVQLIWLANFRFILLVIKVRFDLIYFLFINLSRFYLSFFYVNRK